MHPAHVPVSPRAPGPGCHPGPAAPRPARHADAWPHAPACEAAKLFPSPLQQAWLSGRTTAQAARGTAAPLGRATCLEGDCGAGVQECAGSRGTNAPPLKLRHQVNLLNQGRPRLPLAAHRRHAAGGVPGRPQVLRGGQVARVTAAAGWPQSSAGQRWKEQCSAPSRRKRTRSKQGSGGGGRGCSPLGSMVRPAHAPLLLGARHAH